MSSGPLHQLTNSLHRLGRDIVSVNLVLIGDMEDYIGRFSGMAFIHISPPSRLTLFSQVPFVKEKRFAGWLDPCCANPTLLTCPPPVPLSSSVSVPLPGGGLANAKTGGRQRKVAKDLEVRPSMN